MKAEMLSEHAQEKEQKEKVERLAFVCEGGVGSSAMGAALFRRVLGRKGIEEVRAEAYAADLIPNEVQMIICQKDYYERLPGTLKGKEIYTVESLLKTEEYEELWRCFCKSITIQERTNGMLQQQFLPLKFRKNMTEFT